MHLHKTLGVQRTGGQRFDPNIKLMRWPATSHPFQTALPGSPWPPLASHQHNQSGLGQNTQARSIFGTTCFEIFFANSLIGTLSCRQPILLLSLVCLYCSIEFSYCPWPKTSLVHLLSSNIQLYGRSWSHGSQGSPIPETKRCLRLLNSIGWGSRGCHSISRYLQLHKHINWYIFCFINPSQLGSSGFFGVYFVQQGKTKYKLRVASSPMTDFWRNTEH